MDTDVLEFGACSRLSASEYQAVVVTNTTNAKITAFIDVPMWQDPGGGEPQPVFQVGLYTFVPVQKRSCRVLAAWPR